MSRMHAILPGRSPSRRPLAPLLVAAAVWAGLVALGLALAWAALATPLLAQLVPAGRPSATEGLVGAAAWTAALVAPAGLTLVGLARLAGIVAAVRRRHGPATVARRAGLPDDVLAVANVEIGDGRPIPELLVGSFGVVVARELPPARLVRRSGARWEARTRAGWVPMESPLERATRDAERVRRWFAHADHDFVVKVHAVAVGADSSLDRTTGCAVVAEAQLAAWLATLPAQRGLTPARRERLVERVRDVAG